MPRPVKHRRVCSLPETNLFGPLTGPHSRRERILMTVEEYETIRLMDLEGLMQEECARRMNVARTTVQRIYVEARRKVATALVNGMVLQIEGGNFQLCQDPQKETGCGCCRRRGGRKQENRENTDDSKF